MVEASPADGGFSGEFTSISPFITGGSFSLAGRGDLAADNSNVTVDYKVEVSTTQDFSELVDLNLTESGM